MNTRKLRVLFGGAVLCLFVMPGLGAASDGTTAPSCVTGTAIDQSIPVPDALVAVPGTCDAVLADREEELECTPQASALASPTLMPIDDLADRAAVCLLIPQCSKNADCDAQCGGAGLGRCVHNPCPARVCRCR